MVTVVGLKRVVSKKDSKVYYEIHVNEESRFLDGCSAYNVFVSESNIRNVESLCCGCLVEILYNRFGRVDSVLVVV